MRKLQKNSFEYKIKRWIISVSAFFECLHYSCVYLNSRQTECILLAIASVGYAYNASRMNFSNGVKNNVTVMLFALIASYYYMFEIFLMKIIAIVFVSEIAILIIGMLMIYKKHYGRCITKRKNKSK